MSTGVIETLNTSLRDKSKPEEHFQKAPREWNSVKSLAASIVSLPIFVQKTVDLQCAFTFGSPIPVELQCVKKGKIVCASSRIQEKIRIFFVNATNFSLNEKTSCVSSSLADYSRTETAFAVIALLLMLIGHVFVFYSLREPRYMFKRLTALLHFMTGNGHLHGDTETRVLLLLHRAFMPTLRHRYETTLGKTRLESLDCHPDAQNTPGRAF